MIPNFVQSQEHLTTMPETLSDAVQRHLSEALQLKPSFVNSTVVSPAVQGTAGSASQTSGTQVPESGSSTATASIGELLGTTSSSSGSPATSSPASLDNVAAEAKHYQRVEGSATGTVSEQRQTYETTVLRGGDKKANMYSANPTGDNDDASMYTAESLGFEATYRSEHDGDSTYHSSATSMLGDQYHCNDCGPDSMYLN